MSEQPAVGETTRRTAKNAAVRALAEVLGKVATLAWTVAAARMLTQDDFGSVSYALNLMLIAGAVAAWGFDTGLVRLGSADPPRLTRLYLGAQLWKTLCGVLVTAGVLVVVLLSAQAGPWAVLVLMLLAGFPELWSQTARSAGSARQSSVGVSQALVAQRLITALLILAALVLGFGATGVAAGFLLGTLAGWWLHHRVLRRVDVRPAMSELRRVDLGDAARGTFIIGLSGVVTMLLFRVDIVMLGQMRGFTDVAVYTAAYRLLETVLFVAYAIDFAVFPVMSATTSIVVRRVGFERAMAAAAFCYLPFAAVCVVEGERVLRLLFGAEYSLPAADVLAILAPTPLFLAVAYFGTSLLVAEQRFVAVLVSAVVATVLSVALNLVLIPPYGGPGAAASTTIAYVVQAAVMIAVLRPGTRPRLFAALTPTVVATAALTAVLYLLDLPLLLELPVAAAVFVAVWLPVVTRFAPEQRAVVLGLLRRQRPPATTATD